jgi:hypothetical protein
MYTRIQKTAMVANTVSAFLMLANGIYMIADPVNWFIGVPGMPDSGGYNAHMVRDIGLAYVLTFTFAMIALLPRAPKAFAYAASASWLLLHSVVHWVEVGCNVRSTALVPVESITVHLPALIPIFGAMVFWKHSSNLMARHAPD